MAVTARQDLMHSPLLPDVAGKAEKPRRHGDSESILVVLIDSHGRNLRCDSRDLFRGSIRVSWCALGLVRDF